ncbi:alpha/beta-hydrolase [Clathrospora elynae]|uniref:Alpha/beta-hydrolase n=1 Tax=Clathrospora elynae TaxID=706981 RepID=A0A6A5SRE0_9PLEO|nr:alpha/beta-hydrolase [Clathrospora elynae]
MPSTNSKPNTFPPPVIIPPPSGIHNSTFIILHGRGSTADKFAETLLKHLVSNTGTEEQPFQSHFQSTKFVFPTAKLIRAKAYNRAMTHQWFDQYPLDEYKPEYKGHIQISGLRDSVDYVHGLIKEAVKEVGPGNVVLMGLSQGCATVLTSALLWRGEKLGAVVGMCGWLPFAGPMGTQLVLEMMGRETICLHGRNKEKGQDRGDDNIEIKRERGALNGTPVFLGHGSEDEKVPTKYGQQAASLLRDIDVTMGWKEYEGLGHWYSADMLRDIATFLQRHVLTAKV